MSRKRLKSSAEHGDALIKTVKNHGFKGIQLQLAALDRQRDRHVVAHETEGDLVDHFRDDRIDLARHDGGPVLPGGQTDFAQSVPRAGGHKPQVVADLGQACCTAFQGGRERQVTIRVLRGINEIMALGEGNTGQLRQQRNHLSDIGRVGVDARAHGCAAKVENQHLLTPAGQPLALPAHDRGIRRKFLPKPDRHRILQLRASHFHHAVKRLGAFGEGPDQHVQPVQQAFAGLKQRHFDTGGVDVVGGLSAVDMVVGMNERIIAFFTAQKLDGAVGDYLVGIHIGGSARAPLDGVDDELVMQLPGDQIVTGAFYRIRYAPGQHTGHAVGSCACLLDPCHAHDHGPGQTLVGDRKILRGPQRMNPVVRLLVDLFFAYQIVLRSIHSRIIAPSLSLACFQYSDLVYYFQIPILQTDL